jgi:hypothetical protein
LKSGEFVKTCLESRFAGNALGTGTTEIDGVCLIDVRENGIQITEFMFESLQALRGICNPTNRP